MYQNCNIFLDDCADQYSLNFKEQGSIYPSKVKSNCSDFNYSKIKDNSSILNVSDNINLTPFTQFTEGQIYCGGSLMELYEINPNPFVPSNESSKIKILTTKSKSKSTENYENQIYSGLIKPEIKQEKNYEFDNFLSYNILLKNQKNKNIFKIVKINKKDNKFLGNKKNIIFDKNLKVGTMRKLKKECINWEKYYIPKEKHFHFDKIKHRIVFQRKHLKVIYSLIDLEFPIDFQRCYDIIKKHIGNSTKSNFGECKSFHIVEKNGDLVILKFHDKQNYLREKYLTY